MSDIPPPTEADQDTLKALDPIFNNASFWANDSSEVPEELKQHLKAKVEKHLQEAGKSYDAIDVANHVDLLILREKQCKTRILNMVRKGGGVQALMEMLSVDADAANAGTDGAKPE
eukprot:CAMPEP_0198113682 /NCGR_PEP_ID=MMETSP1442-20131203/5301_1 /TAXON_ID= /ORGANISM="Craspedostauros australis, Strain CCMP3328" /LENGTH=115 /DNA_ID=CAMNT_0043770845 /DNA_START=40 /DNA_END=387 /DNA_ORIENTATION=-